MHKAVIIKKGIISAFAHYMQALMMNRLSLSLRKKAPAEKIAPERPRIPAAGVYNQDVLLPPGINNVARNCYANAVLQCLFNHLTFIELATEHCNPSQCHDNLSGTKSFLVSL